MDRTLGAEDLELLRKDFSASPAYRLAQNAVTRVAVDDVAIDREIINSTDHSLSTLLDDWKVTNQERSGRCWLFAGLNLLRVGAMQKMGLKDFEFSQNYAMFWDKIERANYFLEAIIETAGRDIDDRTVALPPESVASDGGQWNMFVAIVSKHGLVPKSVMPETHSSVQHRPDELGAAQPAAPGGQVGAGGRRPGQRRGHGPRRRTSCGSSTGCCASTWGHRRTGLTGSGPTRTGSSTGTACSLRRSSRRNTCELPIGDYVCLVHDPRSSSPAGRTFTVEYLGNVLGAPPVSYLNVGMPLIKDITSRTLQGGEPVWFGCDVGKMMSNDYAVWDASLYDLPAVYDTAFTLGKADRLVFHETQMTHAMLFTGVDVARRRRPAAGGWRTAGAPTGARTASTP